MFKCMHLIIILSILFLTNNIFCIPLDQELTQKAQVTSNQTFKFLFSSLYHQNMQQWNEVVTSIGSYVKQSPSDNDIINTFRQMEGINEGITLLADQLYALKKQQKATMLTGNQLQLLNKHKTTVNQLIAALSKKSFTFKINKDVLKAKRDLLVLLGDCIIDAINTIVAKTK